MAGESPSVAARKGIADGDHPAGCSRGVSVAKQKAGFPQLWKAGILNPIFRVLRFVG